MAQKHPKAKVSGFDRHKLSQPFCLARFKAGVVAVDTAVAPLPATGAFSPTATPPVCFNATGPSNSVLVTVAFGSGAGSVVLRPMVLDQEGAVWLNIYDPTTNTRLVSPPLDGSFVWEVTTFERTVLFVVDVLTGAPSDLEILIAPGRSNA